MIRNAFTRFTSDGRHLQILFLSCFLGYGIFFLGWEADLARYAASFASCLAIQATGIYFTTKNWTGLKSALISSLSLCLMFKANFMATTALAGVLSIGSKYLIRFNGKHIFNPTNFGIIVTILITGDAWISPGQWGSGTMLIFLIGALGMSVIFRVGRADTGLAFLASFALLHFLRNVVWLGWEMDFFFHQLSSGALLLFTFFMITDPVTTPNAPGARIIWAGAVGALAFVLASWYHVHTAPVWALFLVSPLTPLFDKIFVFRRFQWIQNA